MTFRAKLDDPESRAYWESVERGAKRFDALPAWQKGEFGRVRGARGPEEPAAGCAPPDKVEGE